MFRLTQDSHIIIGSNVKDLIEIENGKITINGINMENYDFKLEIKTKSSPQIICSNLDLIIYGNVSSVNSCGNVSITGNVLKSVNTAGDVNVEGSVSGNVNTVGDVKVGKNNG